MANLWEEEDSNFRLLARLMEVMLIGIIVNTDMDE